MDRILEKIETDREILSTMPKNNKKNIANYLNTLQILKKEYLEKQKEIYDEMNKRYKKIISIKKNPDLEKEQEEIKNMHIILDTIEMTKSSFEKMGLDKRIYKFRRFYKENLEIRKQHDKIKNNYAKNHNIPLVRIPYTKLNHITLEDLMGKEYEV